MARTRRQRVRWWAKTLIGVAITVALLAWALNGVSLTEVVTQIRRGNLWLLAAAAGMATLSFPIRAVRWAVLLRPVAPPTPLRSRFAAVAVHFMANNLIPLRVGEVARAWIISRLEPVKASTAFGTVVVERFMDGVVLLVFLILPVFTPGFPDVDTLSSGFGGLLIRAATFSVFVVLGALIVMAVFPDLFLRIVRAVTPWLPEKTSVPLMAALEAFLASIAILRDVRVLVLGFAWSFFLWAFHAISFWLGMLAFGIDTGYVSALFTSSVVAFGVAIPSAPGFIGTFQVAALFAVSGVYGAGEAEALAFAFGYHFAGFIPITVIGLYFVWRMGLSLGDVGGAAEAADPMLEGVGVVEPDPDSVPGS